VWSTLYRVVLVLALPVVAFRSWWRGRVDPAYRDGSTERWGSVDASLPTGALWFHAVSAGEAIAAVPLIRLALERVDIPVLVTTMTPTGRDAARRLLGARVTTRYAPYDFGWAVRRFVAAARPRALILVETELWPNLIAESHARGATVALVNGRLSARSARGYRLIGGLVRRMLTTCALIACQYPDHAARFIALGAPRDRVHALGSVKFDAEIPPGTFAAAERLRAEWGILDRPVWIAASTHAGEDEIVLAAHRLLATRVAGVLTILVPRHPVRFDAVAGLARQRGFAVARLDDARSTAATADVLIGDAMGRLFELYALAHVAFVGGTLVPHGGHNPIEPAALGLPVVVGEHDFNFADVTALFERAGCLHRVRDAPTLADQVARLLENPSARAAEGDVARQVVADNRGAVERQWQRLVEVTPALRGG
jgi:3-deoxy-D-manno-octulosonic-acid transferase